MADDSENAPSYSIAFICKDETGARHFIEYPLQLLENFEDIDPSHPLSEFIERWKESLDTMIKADKEDEGK